MTDVPQELTARQRFSVTHSAPFEPSGVPAGLVEIDAGQKLFVISAEPAFDSSLNLAASMLNSSEEFLVHESPPPEEETRNQYRRMVARDAPDARAALLDILSDRYGFELTPVG